MVLFGLTAAALVAVAVATAAVVHPGKREGWMPVAETCGSGAITGAQGFERGPATPPAGRGSYFFQIGANGDTYRTLRNGRFRGVELADITAMTYWTYVASAPGSQAVYIDLYVDTDGDGDQDDTLTFEPVYQTAQGPVARDTWQRWDARNGLWWANSSGGPPPLFTLAEYVDDHPNARIVTDQRGLLLSAGCGGAAWTNFDGNVDQFRIAVDGRDRFFNFEPRPRAKPPRGDDGDDDKGDKDKVAVCHKGKNTLFLPPSAVRAHLGHGDTLGRCK